MKTSRLIFSILIFAVVSTQGQISQPTAPASAAQGTIQAQDTSYTVVSKGANEQVWQTTTYVILPSGKTVAQIHQYTELATGLHFWSNGQWMNSKEEVDILPNGTAAATNGQHQAYFQGDIYQGEIELVTPERKKLLSRPLGLSYDDGTKTVLIAELTNSIGYLASSNQVIYPDAFTGLKADLRYTYTKAGFEQDIILKESPLTPESYGLNPVTARLQVLTEFFNPPQPAVTTTVLPEQAGITLTDENLDFGVMKMIPGRAFLLGSDAHDAGALVSKSWVMLNGRQFLVEEVPVEALANQFAQMPAPQTASAKPKMNSLRHVVSAKRLLPAPRLAKTSTTGQFKRVAQAADSPLGLVLDYVTITTQTNYTFQGDSTYYLSGAVNLYRTNTFEGGAVLKYATNASLTLTAGAFPIRINWQASAYRPVIFTAKDDNSVGENITGSTGNPTNYYANPALQVVGPTNTSTISYFRIAYARQAVSLTGSSYNFYHGQIINCLNGFTVNGGNTTYLRNVLFSGVQTNFNQLFAFTFDVQNSTFSSSAYLMTIKDTPYQSVYMKFTNCVFGNVVNITNNYSSSPLVFQLSGDRNGFYNAPEVWVNPTTNLFYPFQSVGAGNYYLANGCSFTNAGTINIDSALLSALRQKTTHPPIVYSPATISTNLTFSPQAQRDSNNSPDLGYHYDPIDYALGGVYVTNATVTVNPGTVLATYATNNITYGLGIGSGAQLLCQGLATNLNRIVQYNTVQEQAITNWSRVSSGSIKSEFLNASPAATIFCRFTDWSMPAQDAPHLNGTNGICNPISLQDCQFHGGKLLSSYPTINLTNCLFERVYASLWSADTNTPALRNNLFWRGIFDFAPNVTNALVKDNLFDQTTITNHSGIYTNYNGSFNAFVTTYNRLQPTNSNDKILTNSPVYQSSWLGNYYLPTNSPLINHGSTNANWVGLYHYTVTTNQVVEGTNVVSIGYHYVATDAYGNPLDSNGDGIPDYLEDANGNGVVDSGETNWGLAILTQPTDQTVVQSSNATFSVTTGGILPLTYQWYFNSAVLAGATNAALIINNVQTTNAGNYYVVVTNVAGSVTSSNAVLTVLVPPSITTQPTNQTAILGTNVTFSVTATGTAPLTYQWWFNGTSLLAGATNAAFTLTNVQTTAAGNYSVVVSNVVGSVTSSNAVLTIRVAIPMATVGGERIMELTGDGDVISWGGNQYGDLGDYTFLDSSNPVHVVGLTNLIKIASGLNHSLAIDSTGALWAWGNNQFAQLGDGVFDKTNRPVHVLGMTNSVIAIAGGTTISIAAKADGTVWTWGTTFEGSDTVTVVVPAQVQGLTNVIAVAAGDRHFLALSIDSTVWAWGENNYGQLGDGMVGNSDIPIQVSGLSNIVAICAGAVHSMALDTNGCVWAWGLNDSGQLGDGGTEAAYGFPVLVFSNAVQIAAGRYHSLTLDNDSNVWVWGDNNAGQLGTNGFSSTNLPVKIIGLTNIIGIAAGSDASAALDGDGNLWQWGASDGDGTNWTWGDENELPTLAPGYDDFYDGQLPYLTILNGNIQTPHAGLEFPQPLVFQVTDTNGVALSNAPVSVEVIAGDMVLRTVSGGSNYKGLRLTTDTNGEVSLIGFVDQNFSNPNCKVKVLVASRERIIEVDFNETLVPRPTISFTSPMNGGTYLLGTNQTLTITVEAQAAPGASIQEVDYEYGTNSVADTTLGTSTLSPFSFTWTNILWWTNAFVGQYTLSAVAVDNAGAQSDPQSVTITIALDSDGNGMPNYWQLQYFGHLNVDPDADPDGDGISNLQEFQQGTNPTNYYNGNLPNLRILSGNNQGGIYDSFLPFPVIIGVDGAYSSVLKNAPLTFTVTNGTALLATNTSDTPASSLSLRTDSNGQASILVYFPAAGSDPPDSTIVLSAYNGLSSCTTNINEYVLLAHWHFDNTNTWIGEAGQLPLLTNNLVGAPSWSSNAVLVDSAGPSLLTYNVVEINGNTNINCETGSVLFYFKPDWSGTNASGDGPGVPSRLIEMGNYDPAFTNGWWSLYLSPDGTQLLFGTSTNGGGMTNLTASISWASNTWYQVALAYSPTGSALFVDGQLLTNGAGVIYFPNTDELTNGFRIGSDRDGSNQAAGTFDELETFASPLSGIGDLVDTYWFGIPDYKADPNGTLGAWELAYFGHLGLDPNGDYDNDGTNNLQEFMSGTDPNKIGFSISFPNQYVTTNIVSGAVTIFGGVPSSIAILVDNTNLAGAIWTNYTSSNITVNLGTNQGAHDLWVGLMGLPANAQQTWEETTLVLDSIPLTILITNPASNVSMNSSWVDVSGSFGAAALHQITVNGILAFVNGTNFEAMNVPLVGGTNVITAVVEDLTGTTNAASISVLGLTNVDGSMNSPVQLQATPVAGFSPLSVTFTVSTNAPGTLQQVCYDFNGDDIADFVTNSLDPITYTYSTNGEYFPVVTIQTDAGRFSSVGGWNAVAVDPSNQPVQINVQIPATQSTFLSSFSNPVDLKWDGTNLYVLSGTGAAIYEFATDGSTIRSLSLGGGSPSGIDVDAAGNVYVAVTASNQVWKFSPTSSSFQADTNFGIGGYIGSTNGASGSDTNEFNAPFDVAVSPDGRTISVSDSGNSRVEQFSATNGAFIATLGSSGSGVGQFNVPKGLTYDSAGNLYIVDSGSNRIVLAQSFEVLGASGTNGTALGQFDSPVNISVGERGVYVADTGNNRVQCFNLPAPHDQFTINSTTIRFAISGGLNQPAAVAAVGSLTNEMFYIADTGNNQVILCNVPTDNSDAILAVWNSMTNLVARGDISGAMQSFSSWSVDRHNQAFLAMGASNLIPIINQIGTLTPVYIQSDKAEYYFQQTIAGQTITFPVEFVKQNGLWKLLDF